MRRSVLVLALAVLGAAAATGSGETLADGYTMALTGDSIITRRLSVYQEPEFLKMIELIRGTDAAFTNLEMLFHDFEPYPMSQSGGTYMRAEPHLAKELAWAGFDLVSRANNHTGDYGVLGMELTTRYVDEAGLVQAGVGGSLEEAREARFLETARGRVALISVASTFPDFSRAGKTRGGVPPRPGLSPLRFSTTHVVTREQLESLRTLVKSLGLNAPAGGDELDAFRSRFVVGEKPEVRTEPNREDLEEIAAVVRNASRLADYVIVTIHAHEGERNLFVPAQFLVTFARAMVDAGADVFVGHGPHVLRGVEIYKGKPILYSLGDFIFQNETLVRLPSENYEPFDLGPNAHVADWNDRRYDNDRRGFPSQPEIWEAVIAVPHWRGKTLAELRLYPITLGHGEPRQARGRPMLAGPELAAKIIQDLVRLSRPFGTKIDFQDGIGVIRPAEATTP
jgi:poly-gamma-glutamate synthesis protein (capsule biosynthesis protein)